jgi:hypothetical protein
MYLKIRSEYHPPHGSTPSDENNNTGAARLLKPREE